MAVNTGKKDTKKEINVDVSDTRSSAMGTAFKEAKVNTQQPKATTTSNVTGNTMNTQKRNLSGLNSLFAMPMARSSAGESVTGYLNTFKELMADESDPAIKEFNITPLDGETNQLALSGIMLQCKRDGIVGCFTFIVESSGEKLASKSYSVNGQNVEVETVAGDVYDGHYWSKVMDNLAPTYGNDVNYVEVGSTVIPLEMKPDNKNALRAMLYNGVTALYVVMQNATGNAMPPVSVKDIDTGDQLSARLDYNPGALINAASQVVRSDISVELSGNLSLSDSTSAKQTVKLSDVEGYIDLTYVPPAMIAQPHQIAYGQQPQAVDVRSYVPRFVMTSVTSGLNAITMELQLLGISTAMLLSRDNCWIQSFKPNWAKAGSTDLRDIGAIGYEINFNPADVNATLDKIDTKAEDFGDQGLYQMVSQAIHPDLIYSMDIPESGDLTWIQSTFIAAATGDQNAANAILNSANELTNGMFGQIYQGGNPMSDEINRIHLGTYSDEAGVKRDIRDLDYVAMLNFLGARDMKVVAAYSDTFDNLAIPVEIRLRDRAQIIRQTLGETVRVTGFARRVTFNPDFMVALTAALSQTGLVIRPEGVYHNTGAGQRGNQNARQFGVNSQQGGGLFNYSNPGFQGGHNHNAAGPRMGRGMWS